MSAFLGPIHIWLYNKIKFQNEITNEIVSFIEDKKICKNLSEDSLEKELKSLFGELEQGELADIIDGCNIHGWLQERIKVVEKRLAYIITKAIADSSSQDGILEDIKNIVLNKSKNYALENEVTPKEAFTHLESVLLSGMPCDRVNSVIKDEENQLVWIETVDIHKTYWDEVGGNVSNYNEIRNAIIEGLLANVAVKFTNTKEGEFVLSI